MNIRHKYILSFLALVVFAHAQNRLSLESAIKTGLEKNHAVLIYKNTVEAAKTQNHAGNAGMSPTISISGNYIFSSVNSHLEFSNNTTQDREGAISQNLGASLNMAWTVFDGMRMFAVKKRLGIEEASASLSLKQQMETTVYAIIRSYYEMVRVKQLIKAARQNLMLSGERKKLAALKLEIGSDSKVDVLLAQTNENKAGADLLQLEIQLINARTELNKLLANPAETELDVEDSLVVTFEPSLEELKQASDKKNFSLLLSRQSEKGLAESIKEARAATLPQVQLIGAYSLIRNRSEAGFVFLNQQNGIDAGISANWQLFNGFRNKRQVQERSILALNQELQTSRLKQEVNGQLFIAYQLFVMNKKMAAMELNNLKDSEELLLISMERYRLGKTNLLETLEAQKNLQDARLRYINAQFAMKMAETDLLKVSGALVN